MWKLKHKESWTNQGYNGTGMCHTEANRINMRASEMIMETPRTRWGV